MTALTAPSCRLVNYELAHLLIAAQLFVELFARHWLLPLSAERNEVEVLCVMRALNHDHRLLVLRPYFSGLRCRVHGCSIGAEFRLP